MTFVQLWGERLTIELGSADTSQTFTTARRKAAVNNAQDNFARVTGCTRRYGSLSISDGVFEYDLEALLADYIRLADASSPSVKIVSGTSTTWIQGDNFTHADPEWLDHSDSGWRTTPSSKPTKWYTREDGGSTYLGMTPPPKVGVGETWTVIVPYVADPADMSGDSDEPFTFSANVIARLRPYHQALAHYAAAELEPLRKNYSGVTRQMQFYNGYVAQFLEQKNYDMPDQITFARNYFGEGSRGARALDPRRFP